MVQNSPAASYLSTHQHYHNCNSECVISLITRSSWRTGLGFINCIIWGFPELTTGRVSCFGLCGAWPCPSAWPGRHSNAGLGQALGCGEWRCRSHSLWDADAWGMREAQPAEACYEPGTLHMLSSDFHSIYLIREKYHKYSRFTGDNIEAQRG